VSFRNAQQTNTLVWFPFLRPDHFRAIFVDGKLTRWVTNRTNECNFINTNKCSATTQVHITNSTISQQNSDERRSPPPCFSFAFIAYVLSMTTSQNKTAYSCDWSTAYTRCALRSDFSTVEIASLKRYNLFTALTHSFLTTKE